MDGTGPGASICDRSNEPVLFTSDEPDNWTDVNLWHRHSYRLYLLDVPEGSFRMLVIELFAFDRDFERVVKAAAPVLDSFEFHTRRR